MDNIEERSGWFGESLENVMNIEKRLEGFKSKNPSGEVL